MDSNELEVKTQTIFETMAALADEYDAGKPRVPWYDHRYDWLRGPNNWTRLERAVWTARYIKFGFSDVLDLCCGDGFFTRCAGQSARRAHGIDKDESAIAHAKRLYEFVNVEFFLRDAARDVFPGEQYDLVTWYDGLAYMTPKDGQVVLEKVRDCLPTGGLLLGSTPLATGGYKGSLSGNKNLIYSPLALMEFMAPHFGQQIRLWTSDWGGGRVQLYFKCRKGFLPKEDGNE